MSVQTDNICKVLADRLRQPFVAWRLGMPPEQVGRVELENVEFPAVPLRADSVFLLPDLRIVLHVEFQTTFESDLPFRMLNYYVRLYARYSEQVDSIIQEVIVLRPGGSRVTDRFERDQTSHRYRVVEIWRLDGAALLEQEASIPFAVLARWEEGRSALAETRRRIEEFPSRVKQADLSLFSSVLAGLEFNSAEIAQYLPIATEAIMLESPVYREIIERGLSQGLQQG
ncbi:MAG: hypothetical protein RMM31_09650, partial [Anaerolineae bacterium]|nr:hypothetical protein [Anaerolineae bacterium]